ncbi:MAG: glycosyltransferase family 4 protein [Bacteroidota bacterium]
MLTLLGHELYFEWHHVKSEYTGFFKSLFNRFLKSKKLLGSIAITQALQSKLVEKGIGHARIQVLPDAAAPPTTSDAKFDTAVFKVGYLGHLYPGKGMEIIQHLPGALNEVEFHIVGGRKEDVDKWKSKLSFNNLFFHGHVAPGEISSYLNSFDCCLLPNQNEVKTYAGRGMDIGAFTSPLKLFDYLSHGKAIVSSDLTVLREVLHEEMAIFCHPSRPEEWVEAIKQLIADPRKKERLGKTNRQAYIDQYSWYQRAEKLISWIKSKR